MNIETANRVYTVLVNLGGACETDRNDFIYHHAKIKDKATEWRFCGKLGFGGKYRRLTNTVDCYSEDENPKRVEIMNIINKKLKEIVE